MMRLSHFRLYLRLFALGWVLLGFSSSSADEFQNHRLLEAARRGDLEQVKQSLTEGADVNATGRFGITAAWQAAGRGHNDVLRFLVQAGADINIPDSVWHITPVMMVRDPKMVVLLIEHGANGVDGLLNRAALYGDLPLVQAIVGALEIDRQSLSHAHAHATLGKHEEIIEYLEQHSTEPLSSPTSLPDAVLQTYAGEYLSERLNQVEVTARDGRLFLKEEELPELPLVTIDRTTFAYGATRFLFEVRDGKVLAFIREDLYSKRRYVPRALALTDSALEQNTTFQPANDDRRVLARQRWPSFRGIEARGLAIDQDLPLDWSVDDGSHVRWRTPIAGLANSSPIVWDGKVFVTTAVSEAEMNDLRIGLYGAVDAVDDDSLHAWQLVCLDAATGEVLWQQTAEQRVPTVKRHLKSSQANSTPATDGRHVVALFNSGGLFCYDMDGNLIWSKQLGVLNSGAFHDPDIQWGFGSSPFIYRDTVIVQCDLQRDSFIAAYDIRSGSEVWKQPRDEQPSWGSPTVFESSHGPLLLTNATNFARVYDALSGQERWRLGGNAAVTVPTPFVAQDLVFITSGYRPIQPIFAVRLDARGDISLAADEQANSGVVWSKQRGGPYLPTPLAYGGYLYTCANNGILTCYEAKSGKQLYRRRASSGNSASFTASPVAADGRIYLTAESGEVLIVKAGPKFEIIGQGSLGEYCLATPAIAVGMYFARTHRHLVAIGKSTP